MEREKGGMAMSNNAFTVNEIMARASKQKMAVAVVFNDPFADVVRGICAAGDCNIEHLVLRWITLGVAYDMQRPRSEAETLCKEFVSVQIFS